MKNTEVSIARLGTAMNLIYNLQHSGKIFTAVFVKKDGTVRKMNCRCHVSSHTKGGSLKYVPREYGLMLVFDLQKEEYRMINLDTLLYVKFQNILYVIN